MANKIKSRPIWLQPFHVSLASTSQASSADGAVKLVLIDVPYKCAVERIAWINGATAQDNLRVGIYSVVLGGDDPTGGALLFDSGSIAQSGTNALQEHILTQSITLEPGRYYLALMTTGTTMTYMRNTNQSQATGFTYTFTNTGGFAAFAATVPAVTASGSAIPALRMRVIADYESSLR